MDPKHHFWGNTDANAFSDTNAQSNFNTNSDAGANSDWSGCNVNSGPGFNFWLFKCDFYMECWERECLCSSCWNFARQRKYLHFVPIVGPFDHCQQYSH
jgi:hypothetical protein